jgi:hypothetical protein
MIDGDPVASSVREIMAQRKTWIGTAAELLRFRGEYSNRAIFDEQHWLAKKSARARRPAAASAAWLALPGH